MSILRISTYRLAILAVLIVLSVGLVVAANGGVNVSSTTSSNAGTNMTGNVSISGVNYTATDQWVEIADNGTSNVSLTGWKLINMMKAKTYTFPAGFYLTPGAMVKIHSGPGNDSLTDLYNSRLIWDKTGDTAILKDASGKIVSSYTYPLAKAKSNL